MVLDSHGGDAVSANVATAAAAYFAGARPAGVVSAYLFGSHARGTHRESDVDVAMLFDYAVFGERAARFREAVRLCADGIGATHCNEVDVVVLNAAPPELAVGAASGLRLYCADPQRDHAFRRTAMSRLADLRPFLERTRRLKLEALAR